jgi:hypothetical protein
MACAGTLLPFSHGSLGFIRRTDCESTFSSHPGGGTFNGNPYFDPRKPGFSDRHTDARNSNDLANVHTDPNRKSESGAH